MEKKTMNVAFSTQKGGAGKTTLTVLVASYLLYPHLIGLFSLKVKIVFLNF